MPNPQLTAYIQENLSKFSKEVIIQSLSSAGWSAIDISAAFMALEHPTPPVAPQPAPIVTEPAPAVPAQKPDLPQRGEFSAKNSPTSGADAPAYVSVKPVSAPVSAISQNQDPNSAFLAEMEKRRKEADALNPQGASADGITISSSYTQNAPVPQTGLVGMVMKTGLVKNEQQANMALIGIIVVCLGLSAWFIL